MFRSFLAIQLCVGLSLVFSDVVGQNQLARFPAEKLSRRIQQFLAEQQEPQRIVSFYLVVDNIPSFKNMLAKKQIDVGIMYEYLPANTLIIKTDIENLLREILMDSSVRFCDLAHRSPREELANNSADLSFNQIHLMRRWFPELIGEHLHVSVKENQYDTSDMDLRLRSIVTGRAGPTSSTHATLMATIIGGGENSSLSGLGVAPGCYLSSSDFASLLPDPAAFYHDFNIHVQNHSYGVEIENFYGLDSRAYDISVAIEPTLLHVFSAGNAGLQQSEDGLYQAIPGFANLTGSFKMAKNIITVGVIDTLRNVAPRSSRGPAYDGRIKPDMVAFGQDGSSNGAAIVSGISLIIQEAYLKRKGNFPSAALVKAILLNTATDVGPEGVDFLTGFGNVNAYKALESVSKERFDAGSVQENEIQSFFIELPENAVNLCVTCTWIDPPAEIGAKRALINDLDLTLTHQISSRNWLPGTLSTFPHEDSLIAPAKPGKDRVNNVEQIVVKLPPSGKYEIEVHGFEIPGDRVDFSIAYNWDTLGHFQWTFPNAPNKLQAGERVRLGWETNLSDTMGKIDFSFDEGHNWETINHDIRLSDQYFTWQIPDTCVRAILRFVAGESTYLSDTFIISRQIRLRVGYNCADSLFLFWNKTPGISSYELYALNQKYLEPIAVVNDTFFQLEKAKYTSNYFAVAPLVKEEYAGMRSSTIDYATQGVSCYFKNFLVDLIEGEQAWLRMQIGTTFGIHRLFFEKWNDEHFQIIASFSDPNGDQFAFFDGDLEQGVNSYRASIQLANGSMISTDTIDIFFLKKSEYLVFPNPSLGRDNITVTSGDFNENDMFLLFDVNGRLLITSNFYDLQISISINQVPDGIYAYQIMNGSEQRASGKILITK